MDRGPFTARTSALAALTQCGQGGSSAGVNEPHFTGGAEAPAEIIVSGTKWLLRNGLIQKELGWTGRELVSQMNLSLPEISTRLKALMLAKGIGVVPALCSLPCFPLWLVKILADFAINDITALPPLFCYNF